jgi:hypothetical protein
MNKRNIFQVSSIIAMKHPNLEKHSNARATEKNKTTPLSEHDRKRFSFDKKTIPMKQSK